ncbi:hypothetical protein RDWZM_009819 [Blomia tropicalis]|uniref:Uncharacterized protein n=1 Tax=Blomia tropicalis TaxID=40697 RepID=A0A9Q0M481_BLOTA|nr:hypothetical protein RDWZM_009819 [Blomia tropicalis]
MSSNPPIDKLDRIMAEYMEYQKKFGKITPKAHFLTHYNELIRFYGKLQPYSTARYERKNGQNKKFIKHSKNFRNTVYSMAHLHQDYAAITAISEEGTSIDRKDYDAVPAQLQPFNLKCNIIRRIHNEDLYVKPENFFYLNGSIHVDDELCTKLPRSNRSRRGNPDDEQPEEMENSRNITINITEKLKGADNWTSWKRQVKAHLLRLRAIKAIEEEIPDESLKNADALSLIIGSIEHNLLLQIPESSSAFHTWKSLGERFDVKHHASLFNLIGELKTIVWNRTENIEDHLNKT